MNVQDRHALTDACETYKIKLPTTVVEAGKVADATTALAAEIRAEIEPDPYSVTLGNLAELHRAMFAWPSHDERQKAADRLAGVADTYLSTAWDHFIGAMLEAFRKPFNDAVARLLADDPAAVPAAQQLARVRDILANNGRRATVRSDVLERATRVLVVPSYSTALNSLRSHTTGLDYLSRAWCDAVLTLGCQIAWQTPDEQEAADRTMPAHAPAPSAA